MGPLPQYGHHGDSPRAKEVPLGNPQSAHILNAARSNTYLRLAGQLAFGEINPHRALRASARGSRVASIALQLVERGETAGQGEDQRLDRAGDFQTVASRPIRVGGDGSNAWNSCGPGKKRLVQRFPATAIIRPSGT